MFLCSSQPHATAPFPAPALLRIQPSCSDPVKAVLSDTNQSLLLSGEIKQDRTTEVEKYKAEMKEQRQ